MLNSPLRGGGRPILSARSAIGGPRESNLPPIQGNKICTTRPSKDTLDVVNQKYSPDIAMMMQIRREMESLIALSTKLINDNEATPDIQTTLSPIIANVSRAFDVFYKNAMHYFSQHQKMSQSAKTNQVLSSSSCRIPIQNLKIEWQQTCKIIDIYTESHPPPHAEEIKTKFQAILSAFSTIQQANEKKKLPNIVLQKSLGSIKLLCENLSQNINNLFHQQAFPHFETDLLKGYTNDVQSFKKVLIDAFANDFLQAGLATSVLMRLKANFIADCNSIVDSLKSAFAFPDQMTEIHSTKESLIKLFDNVFEKLSVPFAVIKPKVVNETTQRTVPPPSLAEIEKMEAANEERKRANDFDNLSNSAQTFVKAMLPFVTSINLEKDLPSTLLNLIPDIVNAYNTINDQNDKIDKLRAQMKEDIIVYSQKKGILESKITALTSTVDEKSKQYSDLNDSYSESNSKIRELESTVESLNDKINAMTLFGNPATLRLKIGRLIGDLEEIFNEEHKQINNMNDGELTEELSKYIESIGKTSTENQKLKDENEKFKVLVDKVKGLIGSETNNTEEIYNQIVAFKQQKDDQIKELNDQMNDLNAKVASLANHINIENKENNNDLIEEIKQQFDKQTYIIKQEKESHKRYVGSIDFRMRNLSKGLSNVLEDEIQSKVKEVPEGTEESITKLTILIQEQIKDVGESLKTLKMDVDEALAKAEHYKTKELLIEKALSAELNIDKSQKSTDELILLIIAQIKNIRAPYEEEAKRLDSKITDLDLRIRIIYNRLCAIVQRQPGEGDTTAILDAVTEMLSHVQDITDKSDLRKKVINDENTILRQCIERLYVQLRGQAVKIEPELDKEIDINTTESSLLIEKVKQYVDVITSPSYSEAFIEREELKKMFAPAMKLINNEENEGRNDFIYKFVAEYVKMNQTIKILTDFSNTVNTTKKFIDDNNDKDTITNLPSKIETIRNAFNANIQGIQYPPIINLCYRFIAIIDYLISVSGLANDNEDTPM